MRYAVIMAGGAGRRLWPLSRESRPKQLLPLLGGRNLLQLAAERLEGLFAPENVWVITNAQYASQVADALPHVRPENVVGEPEGRDTANAIALAAELIGAADPEGTMAVFTADHVIRPQDRFAQAVETALAAAEAHDDALLTFGVRPTWAHPGLGYIHFGEALEGGAREVVAFREKPEPDVARQYLDSGEHYWNSGMFVWTLRAIRRELERHLPASVERLRPIGEARRDGGDVAGLLAEAYPTLQKISIDYAVMEKAEKVLVVELNCEWLDVGSWPMLGDVVERDEAGNAIVADHAIVLNGQNNVIVCEDEHLVAVVGMTDCVVVRSADATLVCSKEGAQKLKELVAPLEARYGKKFL